MDALSERADEESPSDLVSIGLPVFNGEPFVDQALEAILAQNYAPVEVVVCDNASTDGTWQVLQEHAKDSRVTLVGSDVNLGAVANFNRAFSLTRGQYFAWAAADDRFAPTFISKCLDGLRADPGACGCLPGIRFIDEAGETIRLAGPCDALSSRDLRTRLRAYLALERWTEAYALFRRDALQDPGPFRLSEGPDVLLIWRLLLRGHFAVVQEPLLEYREYAVKDAQVARSSLYAAGSVPKIRYGYFQIWSGMWALASLQPSRRTRWIAHAELLRCLSVQKWRDRMTFDGDRGLRRQKELMAEGRPLARALALGKAMGLYVLLAAIDPRAFRSRIVEWRRIRSRS